MYLLIQFFFISFILSLSLFYLYKKIANKNNIIDKPDEFSTHSNNIPTGSGIVIIILLLIFFSLIQFLKLNGEMKILLPNRYYLIFMSISILGFISFYDDIKIVHPLYRLCAHLFVALISLAVFSYIDHDLFLIIPEKLFIIIFIFLFIYLINIYNFLDGSDGYLTINALTAFVAYCLTFINEASLDLSFYLSFCMIPILLGYLVFNFPKASLFMGDSGSIAIGYLIAYIFFILFLNGNWNIALAIIAYPILDVSFTIIIKMRNGNNPWERLFDYFFLRALVAQNNNHRKIFFVTLIYNLINLSIIIVMIIFKYEILFFLSIILAIIKILLFNYMIKFRV